MCFVKAPLDTSDEWGKIEVNCLLKAVAIAWLSEGFGVKSDGWIGRGSGAFAGECFEEVEKL